MNDTSLPSKTGFIFLEGYSAEAETHPSLQLFGENCLTCHNPHGSNHARLLAEKAPNVCQDCHDAAKHPGTVYDAKGGWRPIAPTAVPNNRLVVRGCVNCHFQVHGSNAPAMRGKFFLR